MMPSCKLACAVAGVTCISLNGLLPLEATMPVHEFETWVCWPGMTVWHGDIISKGSSHPITFKEQLNAVRVAQAEYQMQLSLRAQRQANRDFFEAVRQVR